MAAQQSGSDRAGAGRGPRGRRRRHRISLPDHRPDRAVLRPPRLQHRRPRDQPACAVARTVVRRTGTDRGWAPLRPAGREVRTGGTRSRRPRGDARGRRERRSHPTSGAGGQGAGLRAVHRLGGSVGTGGTHRADRLGARVAAGAAHPPAAATATSARRVRCRRRHRGHLQRADRRRVLRPRGDSSGLRDRGVRGRGAEPP